MFGHKALQILAVALFVAIMFGLRVFVVSMPAMFVHGFVAGMLFTVVGLWLGSDDKRLW